MTSHLERLLMKAEALACQCEPMIGYSCNVHQLFQEIRQQIAAGAAGRAAEAGEEVHGGE